MAAQHTANRLCPSLGDTQPTDSAPALETHSQLEDLGTHSVDVDGGEHVLQESGREPVSEQIRVKVV